MKITRQQRRTQERKRQKEENRKLVKQLDLSDFVYLADDRNMTFSAMGLQLVDFLKIIGLTEILQEHVQIEKRESTYSSEMLSRLLILQNILGYDRIETSRTLDQDHILKDKIRIENYPDPETFRDELKRYSAENIEHLFFVNKRLMNTLTKLVEPQYVALHYDAKVITVYGDQEQAEVGYNPEKPGRKSYHLKICTVEPLGFILAIALASGNAVSSTDFVAFHRKCIASVPQNHFVVRTVRLDRGFFGEEIIEGFEADTVFFEIVAKQYPNIKRFIESIPEEDFEPFYPDHRIDGTAFSFCLKTWKKPRDFVVVRKLVTQKEDNGQVHLFPKYRYQVICNNQQDMSPKEVWQDYNKRATIELTVRDLDYDHFITKVPTGLFLSNYAYLWHCVLSYNLVLFLKKFVLGGQWVKTRLATLRKKLIGIPGRLVNHHGKKIMKLIADFPHEDVLQSVKERLLRLYQQLHPQPV